MTVLTAFGHSNAFKAGDGIDQGDAISPLIWKIFYDPLLARIQRDPHNGYIMETDWRFNSELNIWKQKQARIAGLAFMDDTVWIHGSKQGLQRIIDISDSFFNLNDIQIKGEKSELLCINSDEDEKDNYILMGSNRNKVEFIKNKEIRYLGV